MKNMKRIAGLLLALVMVLAMIPASAENNGTITINGVGSSATYEIYKLLDLESYDKTTGAYSYKVNANWAEFFNTDETKAYFTIDGQNYATWIGGDDDETVATFAKNALAYAKENGIAPVKSSKNEGEFVITESSGVFSGLELGYYLVDSTVGALCGLNTTNPDASINAKNGMPTIDKQVKEDVTGQWGDADTADIVQTVEYRVTVNVHAGAENYVLHDTMDDGLTFKEVVKVEHNVNGPTHDVPADKYEVKTGDAVTDGCDFEIHFSKELCDELVTNDKLIVYYNAMLNRDALNPADGNINTAWLTFGEGNSSNEDAVTTKTYAIDIIKTDSQNNLIDGAQFRIYDALTEGNEIKVTDTDDNDGYRRARDDEAGVDIIVKNGKARVVGLDNGTYYLEEKVAPAGYNTLSSRQKFFIADNNLDAVFNGDTYSTGFGVQVVNKTGSMLPETGGVGTTLFYIAGGVLVAAAVVLLITRKRMEEK